MRRRDYSSEYVDSKACSIGLSVWRWALPAYRPTFHKHPRGWTLEINFGVRSARVTLFY